MLRNKPIVSIIIVNYRAKEAFFECLRSIYNSKIKVYFEVVVVDNDEIKTVKPELCEKFKNVRYIENKINNGWGGGVNLGARYAEGKYLYFLNPDTLIFPKTIDALYLFMQKYGNTGVASSIILDPQGNPYAPQGSKELTPFMAIVLYSFISKLLPKNFLANKFWMFKIQKKQPQEVAVATLTGALIKKGTFEKVGRFDEKIFLYFEEYDLGKRISRLEFHNYILPESKIVHKWGLSSKNRTNLKSIFIRSRFYYFKKHFGVVTAFFVEFILRFIRPINILLLAILASSAFLNLYKLSEKMVFIGDQGWFYLSARDMLIKGQIPLVGIASSHPWLHQGPFWTYILGVLFWLFNFNPLAPGYFIAIIGVLTVLLTYKVGSSMFSRRIALIASTLYSTSPLIINSNLMPYHTSLISLFTLLFIYSVYRWMNGRAYFFPLIFFLLAVLYNFEISTALLWFPFALILTYGIWKRANWTRRIAKGKIIAWSLLGLIIPMTPMIIYDTTNGFPQTVRFWLWVGYHVARIFGFPSIHGDQQFPSPMPFLPFTLSQLQQLVFLPNLFFTVVLLLGSLFSMTYLIYTRFKNKKNINAHIVTYLILIISAIGYIGTGVASSAYFPLFFPSIMFMLAIGFDCLLNSRRLYVFGLAIILLVVVFNGYLSLQQDQLVRENYGSTFSGKVLAAKTIIQMTHGREYNLIGKGTGSQFASFTMNYEYLTWWLGHGPSKNNETFKIFISESLNGIKVESKNLDR